jgi:phage tail tape-measure protein
MTRKLKNRKNHRTEAVVAASGTAAGAAVGSVAGPVGAVAGAIVGGVIGAAAGAVLEQENERAHQHDEHLDEDIGVYDGQLGAASPDAPPARVGAFSVGASGGARPSKPPTEGDMQDVD